MLWRERREHNLCALDGALLRLKTRVPGGCSVIGAGDGSIELIDEAQSSLSQELLQPLEDADGLASQRQIHAQTDLLTMHARGEGIHEDVALVGTILRGLLEGLALPHGCNWS